ncbi:glutathione S-transferase [Macrolepiota fuliginosa MF-IS2]|uniref:glutathione transferase n=1 Tax=Macrolepiota fuliginosa MF-IS2 TaxID=1400762 RepID=A0A9P5XFL7_9AGAR|nr:glutathione S-transferase [Macrolepiota fuliginosa MF-IS2]
MVVKLYGVAVSPNVTRVGMILHEKNVPFEFITVKYSEGEHKSPEYLAKQPFGQIPYLDDDGFIIYESRAIARYIAEKYADQGTKLIPTDVQGRALFEQAASIETSHFDAHVVPILVEGVLKKMRNLEPDKAKYEEAMIALASKLDVYEQILSKQRYLAGNELTLADLFHIPFGDILPKAGCNAIQERPNVARWFSELAGRPSWQAVKDGAIKSTV